ncbi:Protein O-mannosyl-transferase TMTC1 [Varanus komodoensis]|nr:Protein O-mannosyl-transferase TMTC1 [Varanus komodoensis]
MRGTAAGGSRSSRESRALLQQQQQRRPPWAARPGRWGAAAAAASLAALCYWNSLRGEFVHDDVWAIVNNPDARPGAPLAAAFADDFWGKGMAENTSHKSYRPLCILTFKLNILLAGMNPFYFHAVNVVLHCLVTLVLMYTCDKAVFKDSRLAFVTALYFAVHPIHTEAVTGIVGRADVLACLLFLLAFLSYNRSVDQLYVGEHFPPTASLPFLLLSLFLGTCAMLVKETGITVFGVCLVYDGFLLSQNRRRFVMQACSFPSNMGSAFLCGIMFALLLVLMVLNNQETTSQRNGGVHQRMARQPAASLHPSLQLSSSSRENGKHRVAHKGTWNSYHPASPEEQQRSSPSVLSKAAWAVLSYLTTSNKQKFLYTTRPFLKRAALVLTYNEHNEFQLWLSSRRAETGLLAAYGKHLPMLQSRHRVPKQDINEAKKELIVILLLYFRLWIMGGSMPAFSEQDNPASFSPYLLTRKKIQRMDKM